MSSNNGKILATLLQLDVSDIAGLSVFDEAGASARTSGKNLLAGMAEVDDDFSDPSPSLQTKVSNLLHPSRSFPMPHTPNRWAKLSKKLDSSSHRRLRLPDPTGQNPRSQAMMTAALSPGVSLKVSRLTATSKICMGCT